MPPSVRIEAKAWDDPRFGVMGRQLGIDRDLVVIKFARIWAHQTEIDATTVPAGILDVITGIEGFAAAALAADLAVEVGRGQLYVRGSADDMRINWLGKKRRAAQLGGLARASGGQRDASGRFTGSAESAPAEDRPVQPAGELAGRTRDSAGRMAGAQHRERTGNSQPPSSHAPARSPADSSPPAPAPAPAPAPTRRDHMDPEGSPSARRPNPPSVEAEELADLLRQQLIAQKPDHILAKAERWKTIRPTWSRELDVMLKADDRKPARAAAIIRWTFGAQGGSKFRFVVDDAKDLREKWDRIESAMSRPTPRRRPNGSYNPIATGGDEDPVLNQPKRKRP